MQNPGTPQGTSEVRLPAGAAMRVDTPSIITNLKSAKEARALPCGSIVGDLHGGLTFTDEVAATLERRSLSGWQEVKGSGGQVWTIIVVNLMSR